MTSVRQTAAVAQHVQNRVKLERRGSNNTTMSLRLLQSTDLLFVIVKYVSEANGNNGLLIAFDF